MESFIAIYDACVLYPNILRGLLIHLATLGYRQRQLRAKWTGRIHREWMRAVLRRRPELREKLRRTRRNMDSSVTGCRVRGYRPWEGRLTLPDPGDRHVLAAALACVADVIVTFNIRDFPDDILRLFGVTAITPDAFALRFLDSGIVVAAAAEHRASLRNPPMTVNEYLDALRRNGLPNAAEAFSTHEI